MDSLLTGSTAIERADDFCNQDYNKPNNSTYKALMVDGINRSASPVIDWVLLPDTIYYRQDGQTVIGQTNSLSIFSGLDQYSGLVNSISSEGAAAWTGIGDYSDFSVDAENCTQWSTSDSSARGQVGLSHLEGGGAFYQGTAETFNLRCSSLRSLYCVEQH